jgi:putative transposase
MHLTLKKETTRPAPANLLQQQERFGRFRGVFNDERPHEALEMQPPATCYSPSERRFPERLPEPEYPLHDLTKTISSCGHLGFGRRTHIFVSMALAGQRVGLREVAEDRYLLNFVDLELGHVDLRTGAFERREVEE